ncbi:hypothetical protein, partial [Escherichia coli]|uniref:hypothetical protein n=1 Tax=Escherichia coli TaxID=562 RepID=UPI0024AF271A
MVQVGRTGSFIPVKNGGTLYRVKDGKFYAVTGTKGYRWIERDTVSDPSDIEIDMEYFENLKAEALSSIETHGS